jgi:hypothetical protein
VSRELFIYWRVTGSAAEAEAAARRMQGELRGRYPALVTRLYRKLDDRRSTMMETYALPGIGIGIDATLQRQIEAAGFPALATWCTEGRHVEVFEDCS